MSIKKGWKITWISLGSLLGLVVILLVVALWLVFTPSKLTKIVNGLTDKFVTCEATFGNVDLTLLSTFPDAGLKIENVVIINPMEGASNDTLACIGSLTVGIDVKAFIKENKVVVHQLILDDASANLYINRDGKTNFDIVKSNENKEADTSSSSLPELIDINKVRINNLNACFKDERDGMDAVVDDLDLSLKGKMDAGDIDGKLSLDVAQLLFAMRDAVGNQKMSADLSGLSIDAKGQMTGENIDAKMAVESKQLCYEMKDSAGAATMKANLDGVDVNLKGEGTLAEVAGKLMLEVEKGTLRAAGTEMINENLLASKEELLEVEVPFSFNLQQMMLKLGESSLKLDDYRLLFEGMIKAEGMDMDLQMKTDGTWQIKPLLSIIPETYTKMLKGMEVDGKVGLEATAKGALTDTTMPVVDARLTLDKGKYYYPSILPYKINHINADMTAHLDMGKGGVSSAIIKRLTARSQGTDLNISGRADDLMGDMRVDATAKGSLPLEDVMPMMPEKMKITAKGDADVDLHANFKMSQVKNKAFDKMKVSAALKMKKLDVTYDSLHATAPWLDIALQIPSRNNDRLMADAFVTSGKMMVNQGEKLNMVLENADISVGVNDIMKQQLAASYDIKLGETEAEFDSTLISLGGLKLKGAVQLDSTQSHPLLKLNPTLEASTHSAVLYSPTIPDALRLSELVVDYKPNKCDIKQVQVRMGHSDFSLYGTLDDIENWLSHKTMLKGDLNLTSSYADVDQLMDIFSGMGSDKDSLEMMRKEDSVPPDAKPFIVPKDVDIAFHTHIQRSVAFGNDLNDVAGSLTVKDGVVVLDQMGFVCKAATMQLTALYRSPRPNNLFVSLDFHLLDIQIHELLEMIPAVDTLVPMLSAFDGNANFHLAGETYLDAFYRPKLSSIMGASAITGENLVVMDNKSIANIARLMKFKSWKDKDDKIKVDSMSVELTCMDVGFGPEVEVLPFLLNIGSYQICASGVQSLNSNCNYHLELLKNPFIIKVGVDVKGTLSNPKISLGKIRYSDLYKPKKQGVAEKKALEIKAKVRKALEANVR